jgi:hypothetical protein
VGGLALKETQNTNVWYALQELIPLVEAPGKLIAQGLQEIIFI